jgi:hypothetical protein
MRVPSGVAAGARRGSERATGGAGGWAAHGMRLAGAGRLGWTETRRALRRGCGPAGLRARGVPGRAASRTGQRRPIPITAGNPRKSRTYLVEAAAARSNLDSPANAPSHGRMGVARVPWHNAAVGGLPPAWGQLQRGDTPGLQRSLRSARRAFTGKRGARPAILAEQPWSAHRNLQRARGEDLKPHSERSQPGPTDNPQPAAFAATVRSAIKPAFSPAARGAARRGANGAANAAAPQPGWRARPPEHVHGLNMGQNHLDLEVRARGGGGGAGGGGPRARPHGPGGG